MSRRFTEAAAEPNKSVARSAPQYSRSAVRCSGSLDSNGYGSNNRHLVTALGLSSTTLARTDSYPSAARRRRVDAKHAYCDEGVGRRTAPRVNRDDGRCRSVADASHSKFIVARSEQLERSAAVVVSDAPESISSDVE